MLETSPASVRVLVEDDEVVFQQKPADSLVQPAVVGDQGGRSAFPRWPRASLQGAAEATDGGEVTTVTTLHIPTQNPARLRRGSYCTVNGGLQEIDEQPYRGSAKKIAEILGRTMEYLEPLALAHGAHFGTLDLFDTDYPGSVPDPANPPEKSCNIRYVRWRVRRAVEHIGVRLCVFLLIVADITVVIVDLTNRLREHVDHHLAVVSFALAAVFLVEVLLRIFGLGPRHFFNFRLCAAWWNVLDAVCVFVSFAAAIADLIVENTATDGSKLVITLRAFRIFRLLRVCTEKEHLVTAARQMISENKRRYQQDGFDLDLCYVTKRVIAMSFPSSGKTSMYRNPIQEVSRFFNTKHPNKYMIYNLCSERRYDIRQFHGHVRRIRVDDHNVPTLQQMLDFTMSAIMWLSADPDNVVAVHCKGGKGRTGTMICVYMVETGLFSTADESLDYFGSRRTDLNVGAKFQGVETPSQSRYVGYYEWMKNNNHRPPPDVPKLLTWLMIYGVSSVGTGDGKDFNIIVSNREGRIFQANCATNKGCVCMFDRAVDVVTVDMSACPALAGDVQLKFKSTSKNVPIGYEKSAFYFWFHTGFIENNRLCLKREHLDNPHKPKTWSVYSDKFEVLLEFA